MRRGNPDFNPTLATAIYKAKVASMPNDNIDRAVKRAPARSKAPTTRRSGMRATGQAGGALCSDSDR